MTETMKESVFKEVLLHSETNNFMHRTNEMSKKELIVRRGQPFTLTLTLAQPLRLGQSVVFTAATGSDASEKSGTLSIFGINVKPSLLAKAVWKMELDKTSDLQKGNLSMIITPPADSPIGKYTLSIKHKDGDTAFATVVVLFNPWCSDDTVFLSSEKKLKEYVLNEEGKVYYGSADYISSMDWNFGQFGDKMVEICLKLLDYSTKHNEDPAADVASRSDPLYVGRVVSAMINVQDDYGVLVGNWSGSYEGGSSPTHWTSSHNILMEWYNSEYRPVRYGQCWVFASVMCSVMRMLGVPTRVVTNFCSAHDTNSNLIIDKFHDEDGAELNMGGDSVWNFHVWVESWMKRPDLGSMFDGWQVLDPTPQETSDGIYCCGPASVKAIRKGETATNYDVPFVFAEVNADCVDWQFQADGSKVKLKSDSKRVGRNISTKAVGINKRKDITLKYKHKEGSKKERRVFIHAITRDYTKDDEDEDEVVDSEEEEEEEIVESEGEEDTEEVEWPPMSIEFEEMTPPMIGKDVSLRLVVRSKTTADIQLIIKISVQAMRYNGTSAAKIQTSMKEETLQPGKDLYIPIVVPYDVYHKPMLSCESLKISAVIQNKYNKENLYLAEDDVLLLDPPLIITVCGDYARVNRLSSGKLVFTNNLSDVLKNCTLTLSGNGLWKEDVVCKIPELKTSTRITAMFSFCPYKPGKKTLVGVFDCDNLKDVKGRCKVNVLP